MKTMIRNPWKLMALCAGALLSAGTAAAYEWSTTGYGTSHAHPPYDAYIRADRQRTPAGSYQLTWLDKMNSFSKWGARTHQPLESGQIKAYPSYKNHIDTRFNRISKLDSKVVMSVPTTLYSQLRYASAYDIFFRYPDPADPNKIAARGGLNGINANRYEVMIWLNSVNVAPAGSKVRSGVDIAGVKWDIWKAVNIGSNDEVWSLVRTQETQATYVDVLKILKWMDATYDMRMNDLFLITASFGFEITGTPWQMDFTTNEFYLWLSRN